MKYPKHITEIYSEANNKMYTIENGLTVWDVTLDAGIGEEITIGHVSDLHYNYCNQQDFDKADPVLMSTYENRKWLANGESVPNNRRCLEFLDDVDQIVVNGDVMDYLSYGCMELMQKEIWDKYPDALVTVGGHEFCIKMQGKVPETTSFEEREAVVADFWKSDIHYETKLIKDKLLIIGLNNNEAKYTKSQEEKLKKDIELAREKGYKILVFQHEPLCTRNPEHTVFPYEKCIITGDTHDGKPFNLCDGVKVFAGSVYSDEQTMKVYKLLTENADVIKGIFAGHFHNCLKADMLGSYPDGTEAYIPQYVRTASAYDMGHVMRIIVK